MVSTVLCNDGVAVSNPYSPHIAFALSAQSHPTKPDDNLVLYHTPSLTTDTLTAQPTMSPKPSIAILSIGSMGGGIASLLTSHAYPVYSLLASRSAATTTRAAAARVTSSPTPGALIHTASLIFSIVPPRDALATATLVADAVAQHPARAPALTYFDLNAVSPMRSAQVGKVLDDVGVRYIDGGIIGGPPSLKEDGEWKKPSIVLSGPALADACGGDARIADELAALLNIRHLGAELGLASGLKMCFASMTKGLTAISLLSFSTASRLGVVGPLREHLAEYAPAVGGAAEKGLVGCQTKAYRWVAEMEEIAETFDEVGGWGGGEGGKYGNMFKGAADVYRTIDHETDLGSNKRKAAEEIAETLGVALKRRRRNST